MKKIIAYTLIASILILMIGMLAGCKVQQDLSTKEETKTDIQKDEILKLTSLDKVNLNNNVESSQTGLVKLRVVETQFDIIIDKDGNPISVPKSKTETDYSNQTTEQDKSTLNANTQSQQKAEMETSEKDKSSSQSKKDEAIKTDSRLNWLWLIGVGAVVGVFLWIKLKPPNIYLKILSMIKKAFS